MGRQGVDDAWIGYQGGVQEMKSKMKTIRASMMNILDPEQQATALLAAAERGDPVTQCGLLGLTGDMAVQHSPSVILLGSSSTVETGRAMHEWWLQECCRKLGLEKDKAEFVRKTVMDHRDWVQKKQGALSSMLEDIQKRMDSPIGGVGELIQAIEDVCDGVAEQAQDVLQTLDDELSESQRSECVQMLSSMHAESDTATAQQQQSADDWLAALSVSEAQKEQIVALFEELENVRDSQQSKITQLIEQAERATKENSKPTAMQQVANEMETKLTSVRECICSTLTARQQAQALVAAAECGDMMHRCSVLGLVEHRATQYVASSVLMGSGVTTANEMHKWWLHKFCAELKLTPKETSAVVSRVMTHRRWEAEQETQVRKLIRQLDNELTVASNDDVLLNMISKIHGICQQADSYEERVYQLIDRELSASQKAHCIQEVKISFRDSTQAIQHIEEWGLHLELSAEQKETISGLLSELGTLHHTHQNMVRLALAFS